MGHILFVPLFVKGEGGGAGPGGGPPYFYTPLYKLHIYYLQVKQINDSRLVGMSIYNVAVLCMITAPVTLVIADKPNATFAFVALANVFCCFLSMALVFVPKVS